VLPNDCEVQRFANRYGNIVKMRLSLLNGSYRLNVRKLALSIGRNVWKHNAEIFVTMCSSKIVLITLKSIYFELTRIAHRCMSRFEKVRCAKVPALNISSWWYSELLNWSLVHLCKNVSQRLLACFWAV